MFAADADNSCSCCKAKFSAARVTSNIYSSRGWWLRNYSTADVVNISSSYTSDIHINIISANISLTASTSSNAIIFLIFRTLAHAVLFVHESTCHQS